ncbi:UPF0280 family protein [Vineibacter terrae]|uniref:UPF0280 family protein n=1 Tax=Vineibacter terrae TaxID=2586908 RepID=A0A5C8PC69_9HYPH|nr:UPF0280 family protein [Vineibacter terrae]TXL70978.1 UPF0280 family protein [Vineibacter terrae]
MPQGPQVAHLADGRLHLQHGPIDLIIQAWGAADEVDAAYRQAIARFADVLEALVRELAILRAPVGDAFPMVADPVARRMAEAVWPYRDVYITPMAAVAGAVADEMLAAMVQGRDLAKAYVNNGGDIAFHLAQGESLSTAVVANIAVPSRDAVATLAADMPVRGLATSGWRGRSFSLGIADSATILAGTAAVADAAATIVGNAILVDHPAVERRPASSLRDDTDLGALLVTTAVGPLPAHAVAAALDAGAAQARRLQARGLIVGAALSLQGAWRLVTPEGPR